MGLSHFPTTSPHPGGLIGDAIYSDIILTKTLYNHFPAPKRKNKSEITGVINFSWTQQGSRGLWTLYI